MIAIWNAWPGEFKFWAVIIILGAIWTFIDNSRRHEPPYRKQDHRPRLQEPKAKPVDPMIAQLVKAGYKLTIDASGDITAEHPDHKEI